MVLFGYVALVKKTNQVPILETTNDEIRSIRLVREEVVVEDYMLRLNDLKLVILPWQRLGPGKPFFQRLVVCCD